MKLSLSLPALERLLGNDTEMEIELRHQIVENFTKKHLIGVVKSEAYQETWKAMREVIKQAILVEVGQYTRKDYWSGVKEDDLRIKSDIKELITIAVNKAVDEALKTAISTKIESYYSGQWARYIDERVKKTFDAAIDKLVAEGIASRLKAFADLTAGMK